MGDLRLRATLDVKPRHDPMCGPKLIYLTRGATGSISYDLSKKAYYDFKDLDQVKFIFKQNKELYWYNMIDYLVETADTEFLLGKDYYNVLECDPETNQCIVERVTNSTGSPAGYYELSDEDQGIKVTTLWALDDHFSHETDGEDYDFIIFTLSPEETLQFKPTQPENNVKFEINLRVGSEVIVEPQFPIAVFDSLTSQIK